MSLLVVLDLLASLDFSLHDAIVLACMTSAVRLRLPLLARWVGDRAVRSGPSSYSSWRGLR